eukprot:TRINITY_DN1285_c0_g4_i3.p1 TRINITY_DN1285_c0_g4~~TRINITY_DN1285_c0_g4_i3.p1  ORF type:complete len:103 (+),score=31.43 TRINITY_DN1285_c0_g4_i3:406-714(+)
MSLIEMVFHRNADDRNISFADVAQTCKLDVNEVELLLMKAMSLKLIRGVIDQIEQIVRVKWVQPRVLDLQQIAAMNERLVHWAEHVNRTSLLLEQNAPELFL